MRQFKLLTPVFLILVITTAILPDPALSQSGRGRPKIQPTSPAPAQPQPVKIPAAAEVIKQEQAGSLSRFVLKNGITVIINEQYATPIVASVAYFKAGTLDEPEGMSGIARLLERMMFRGTASRPAGRAETDARSLGAIIGADTFEEGTAYYTVAPPDKLKDALAIQADLLANPLLDADDLRREAALAIAEEKYQDSPADHSMARLLSTALAEPRAGRWKPQDAAALRSVTREHLVEFYKAHYKPENLILVVTGAAPVYNTLIQLQQLYGGFGAGGQGGQQAEPETRTKPGAVRSAAGAKRPTIDRPPPAIAAQQSVKPEPSEQDKPAGQSTGEATQLQLRYSADRGDISQAVVSVGFQTPGVESKEWAAMEVLAAMLGQGRASRLNRLLVEAQMAAGRVEADYRAYSGVGLLTIQLWATTASLDKAESTLFRELDGLRREVANETEMVRAKAVLEKRFVDRNGPCLSRAFRLARAEALQGGFRAWSDYRNQIRAVTAQDLQRAAAKYLTLTNAAVHEYLPASGEQRTFNVESFTATVRAWATGLAQPVDDKSIRAAEEDASIKVAAQGSDRPAGEQAMIESVQPLAVKDFSTLNGPRAFVREDHSRPTITVALLFQGGRLLEADATAGTTELMLRSILYGTPRRAGTQVFHEFDQLGATVEIVVEPDFFGFAVSVLARNADRALKLLRDMTEEPAFRDEEIERARIAQVTAIRDDRDSSLPRSRELLLQAMFFGHPYALAAHGREEVVSKITSQQMRDWYAQTVKRQLPIAIIIGDTQGSALVSSQLAEGFRRRDPESSLKVSVPQPAKPGEKSEQRRLDFTTTASGFAGPKAGSGDLAAIELIESAMNGRGGRLLRELRNKQNLAIDAQLRVETLFAAGAVYSQVITPPENEQRARAALLAEMERLSQSGLGADEIASARAVAATSGLARSQQPMLLALEYARAIVSQRAATEVEASSERLSKVTQEEIKRAATVYFKPSLAFAGIVRGAPQPASQPTKQD